MSCHADDLGGAECVEAVHEGDADVDFDGLAVRVSRHNAFAEGLQTAHSCLDPAAGVVSGPSFSQRPSVAPSCAQAVLVVRHAAHARPCPYRPSSAAPAYEALRCSWTSSLCDSALMMACSYGASNAMDPQTSEFCNNAVQCHNRERIVNKTPH